MRSHKTKSFLPVLIILILAVLFLSGPFHEADPAAAPLFGTMRVRLSSGTYPLDTQELNARIMKEDVGLLDYFTALRRADFSGSSCTEEINAWAARHPEVEVLYSVPLPDGTVVSNKTTELDLRSFSHSQLSESVDALRSFTEITSVNLGNLSGADGGLEYSDLTTLRELFPNAAFDFSLTLLGQEVRYDTTSLDLRSMEPGDVESVRGVISCLGDIQTVDLGSEAGRKERLSAEDINAICSVCPNAEVSYSFTLYGRDVSLETTELDFSHQEITDEGEAVRSILPAMKSCKTLDMDSTGVSHEAMARIREENPNVDVIWRVWFGENYSVRTDTERILASKPTVGGPISDASVLKYCTKVKYLDIGHNEDLTDLSFISCMPDLEVCIISMVGMDNIDFLKSCPKLEYLEIFSSNVSDISVLAGMANLRHLNICSMPNLTDISPLFGLPDLERLWIGCETPIPSEQVAQLLQVAPQCQINTTTVDPTSEYWRFTRYDPEIPLYYWVPRYKLLREQLGYNYQEYSFYWLDPKCGQPAPPQFAGMYGREAGGASS